MPTQLGNLDQMTSDFYLDSNLITGAVPTQLGKLTKLTANFDVAYQASPLGLPLKLPTVIWDRVWSKPGSYSYESEKARRAYT